MYYKTQGIILKKNDVGEADKILTLYTPDYGKITCIAKGSRKPKSKLGGHLDILNLSYFSLVKGKSLDHVTGCTTIKSFKQAKNMLDKTARMYLAIELLDRLTFSNQKDRKIFYLLKQFLEFCDEELAQKPQYISNIDIAAWAFTIKLLNFLGVLPPTNRCSRCENPFTNEDTWIYTDIAVQGLTCKNCKTDDMIAIDPNLVKVIKFLNESSFSTSMKLQLSTQLRDQMDSFMKKIIHAHADKKMVSHDIIAALPAPKEIAII